MKNFGEQFIHQKDSKLHTSKEVERVKQIKKKKEDKVSDKPVDKLSDFFDVIERTHTGHREDPRVIERIKNSYYKEYITIQLEDIPQSYWNTQGKIIRDNEGEERLVDSGIEIIKEQKEKEDGTKYTERTYNFSEALKEKHLEIIRDDQEKSLEKWIDYLTSEDSDYIPTWAKYWVFKNITQMGKFEKPLHCNNCDNKLNTNESVCNKCDTKIESKGDLIEKDSRFKKRSKNTTSPFPTLNPGALAKTVSVLESHLGQKQKPKKEREVDNVSKKLSDSDFKELVSKENFSKLYVQFLSENPEYSKEGLEEVIGEWVTFPKGSKGEDVSKTLEGYPLEWCTRAEGIAGGFLSRGDMHIYYSIDENGNPRIPRLTIRMEGDIIAESPKGIAGDQQLDPFINSKENRVLDKKLEEFGKEGERYKKASKDMKKLTEISNKDDNGEELNKEELEFLYEINDKIESFGYGRDSRIKEMIDNRDSDKDALIVFGCTQEQIATNTTEIDENTKVYIGEWSVDIFNTIKNYPNITHLYESFPNKKIFMQSLEADPKINSPEAAIQTLEDKNVYLSSYGKDILEQTEFSSEQETYDLVRFTVEQLGFPEEATTDEIYAKAEELGLELCPAEVGPQLRLQNTSKEWMLIAMKQITDRYGYPRVFSLDRHGDQPFFHGHHVEPDYRWSSLHKFVFRYRHQKDSKLHTSKPKEILNTRDSDKDASIVFECTSEQIAHNKKDINKNTKAYIGEWSVDIFNTIKNYPNITHLYESFPNKKIFMQSLEADPKINSPEAAIQTLEDKNVYLSSYGKDILEQTEFSSEQETYDLVRFTVEQLGFPEEATTDEIYAKAEELGLELCPAEVGPQLRLQNTSKEWMLIAMKQITDRDGSPYVFSLHHNGDQPRLSGDHVGPVLGWSSSRRFVFRYRKLKT